MGATEKYVEAGGINWKVGELIAKLCEVVDRLGAFERIDCGHFVQRDCADAFNDVLLRFLRT